MSIIAGITAGAGLASSLFGGYKAGKERKKMAGQLKGWEAENKAFYNSRALGDYTQRADAQSPHRGEPYSEACARQYSHFGSQCTRAGQNHVAG